METVLLAAGWTTIGGHNTTTLVMQSATTPQGLNMRIKVQDNAGTCVTVSLQNVAGTKVANNSTTAGAQLNPGASTLTYRMVANQYQAFIWTGTPTPSRQFAAFGVPFIPSFLVGQITEAMWLQGNAPSDTSTTVTASWRTSFNTVQPGGAAGTNFQVLCNGNLWENDNFLAVPTGVGALKILPNSAIDTNGISLYQWHDASASLSDALVGWGLAAVTSVGMLRGQLWDAMISSEAYTGDLTTTADGHNWIVITDNNVGQPSNIARGTLFLATP